MKECSLCGSDMIFTIIDYYETKICGKLITVPNARISTCTICKEVSVNIKEMKRWEAISKEKE